MATTLTAFENLKENVRDSLQTHERDALRALSTTEVKKQKDEIWKKSFSVDWKPMKLKDIVANLDFDPKGNVAKVKIEEGKFVTIGWQSELWAAIQVYAIANNKSIGDAWIDGKVWKDTVKWLESTQNSMKAEGTPKKGPETVNEESDVTSRLSDLLKFDYRDRVWKYNDTKYDLLCGDMTNTEWAIKSSRKIFDSNNKETGVIEIQYKSAIWKREYQKVKVDAKLCKTWSKYSADKFWKAIEEAITKKETALKKAEDERKAKEKLEANKKIIVSGVESYDIANFSKKAQSYLKDKNFVLRNNINTQKGVWTWIHFVGDRLVIDDLVSIEKDAALKFCSNWAFNATAFKKYMDPVLDNKANIYYLDQARAAIASINKPVTTSSVADVRYIVNVAEKKLNRIKGLWVTIPADIQTTLDNKKADIKTVEDYNTVSKWVNAKIAEFDKKSQQRMYWNEFSQLGKDVKNRYDKAKANTLIYAGKNVHDVYVKMRNGETNYQNSVVNKLKNVYDRVKVV